MNVPMNKPTTLAVAPVRKSVHVKATPEKAFRIFTAGMARWWRPDHHIAPTPFAEIVVEERAGGRWFERDKDGAECEWGKVLAWDPPRQVILGWQLDHEFKYDADLVTAVEIRFTPEAGGTRVDLEHRDLEKYGAHAERMRASMDSANAWTQTMADFVAAIPREPAA
jgi:uncharacterized protein YndB with AHSA1/START domain